jgi:hypothetical protein
LIGLAKLSYLQDPMSDRIFFLSATLLLVMISKYCAKIINVWDFSDPIVEVMRSEFSGPSLPSIQRRVLYEKFGNKCVKILKFGKT